MGDHLGPFENGFVEEFLGFVVGHDLGPPGDSLKGILWKDF